MKILIIDDNAHHAELAAGRLQKEGWDVSIQRLAEVSEALMAFDFILLDYSMPQVSGIEFLKQMKDQDIRTPVIFLTGHGNEMIASEAIKLGAFDYVVKDTNLVYLDRLPSIIREAKSKHELIETNRFLIQELKRANDRLQKLTFTDEMTKVYNYRFLKKQLETEIQRAKRYKNDFSICIIDVDYFKQINDRFGHPAGDHTLREVARILSDQVRAVDFVGRYAGDEFLIIFPDTKLVDAVKLCERIRQSVFDAKVIPQIQAGEITLSIGASDFEPSLRHTPERLVEAADRCLYRAKKEGRNRVVATLNPPKGEKGPTTHQLRA